MLRSLCCMPRFLCYGMSLLTTIGLSSFANSAEAQLSKTGGTANLTPLPMPADISPNVHQSNTDVFWFAEKQSVSVSNLTTNFGGPVTGLVDSYLLYTDRVGRLGFTTYDITVHFDAPILGIITGFNRLDNTDATLGLPGTIYPNGDIGRGQDLILDNLVFDSGANTLTIHNVTFNDVDEIRVLTAAVPEPGSIALLIGTGVTGSLFAVSRLRGRRK